MKISGWGRYPIIDAKVDNLRHNLLQKGIQVPIVPCIARGLGRSYGDSSLADNIISTTTSNRIYSFDDTAGILTCEAGLSLAEIIQIFLPRGWFLEITPGTKFVTIGGAVASDVHGKNHHVAGCFSESVLSFRLSLPTGNIITCSREENLELFRATCGGMGLTGIILDATLRLQKVSSCFIDQQTVSAANLDETFDLFQEYNNLPYSVAWIDCLAKGRKCGRSVLMVGKHARDQSLTMKEKRTLTMPVCLPEGLLNRYTVSAFNELYYTIKTRGAGEYRVDLNSFFYPLDAFNDWNKIYGSSGFTQYQFVLPLESSREGLKQILRKIAQSGQGSFLAVLKLFGKENKNYLSFPRKGYTLALDFKITKALFPLLNELDVLVQDHGGRLYLTKDVRMRPEMMRSGYPLLQQFLKIREQIGGSKVFSSNQSRRLEL